MVAPHTLKCRQRSCGDALRCGELLTERKGGLEVRILEDLSELWKDLIADGGQFVFPSRAFLNEFVAMARQPFELGSSFRWRKSTPDQVQFISDLDATFQLVVEGVRQAEPHLVYRF